MADGHEPARAMNPFLIAVATAGVIAFFCVQSFVADKTVRVVLLLLLGVLAILVLMQHNQEIPRAGFHNATSPPQVGRSMFTPVPAPRVIARGTPDPAKVREEILRKYGKP
jgi:hypothetical protein